MNRVINNISYKYIEKIEKLVENDISIDDKRICIIDITEKYFDETKDPMPPNLVTMLTEWFLSSILKSKDVDKVSKSEYPILSHHQIKRRNKKQISVKYDILDYLQHPKAKKNNKTSDEY